MEDVQREREKRERDYSDFSVLPVLLSFCRYYITQDSHSIAKAWKMVKRNSREGKLREFKII